MQRVCLDELPDLLVDETARPQRRGRETEAPMWRQGLAAKRDIDQLPRITFMILLLLLLVMLSLSALVLVIHKAPSMLGSTVRSRP